MNLSRTLDKVFLRLTLLLATCISSHAQEVYIEPDFESERNRLQPHSANYAIWQYTEDDDDALEAHYSLKYLVTRPDCTARHLRSGESTDECKARMRTRTDFFIAFTGEFDFYYGTRESGPVVNRRSNPAIHARRHFDPARQSRNFKMSYVDVGLQHFSNGQVVDASLMRGDRFRTEEIFELNQNSAFFDTISREVNYVSLEAAFRLGSGAHETDRDGNRCSGKRKWCYDVWIRAIPLYIDDDNPVTWGPPDWRGRRLAAFDLLKVTLSQKRNWRADSWDGFGLREFEWTVSWTLGHGFLDTDSFDLSLYLPVQFGKRISIPLYVEYHYGPLNNLSNYSRPQNSFGFGLRLN